MKPPPGCQRQNDILSLIAEKGGNMRRFSSMPQVKIESVLAEAFLNVIRFGIRLISG